MLIGGAVIIALLGISVASRAPTLRADDAVMVTDVSCETDPTTSADLATVGGDGNIDCESWDIGTGVTGYAWHAAEPRGAVLFQHGWGDHAQRWVEQADHFIPALLAEGYSVYGFDMWGSGRSPGVPGVTDIRAAVDDHLAARDAIASGPDRELPLFLVGHSIGGLVTATSVLRDDTDVSGVVLLAAGLRYDVSDALLGVAAVGAFVAPAAPVPGMSEGEGPSALTREADAVRAMKADELLYSGPMNFLTASTGGSLAGDNWSRYGQWGTPVLAVHGTADESTLPEGSRDFIDAVSEGDATLSLINGARHALLDDSDAPAVRDEIIEWISNRTS